MHNLTLSQLISFLKEVQKGKADLASLSVKMVDQLFEVETEFKGTYELPLEESEVDKATTFEEKITGDEGAPLDKGKPKVVQEYYTPHRVEALVCLETFSGGNCLFKARVVSGEAKKLIGARSITLIPARTFEDSLLLAVACYEQIEVDVEIFNTQESGRYVYFIENASIQQLDLFNDQVNYLVNTLKSMY